MKPTEALGKFVLIILTVVYTTIINGIALTKLWIWFIVPLFHLPVLNVPYAIGLCLVINFLTIKAEHIEKKIDNDSNMYLTTIVISTVKYLLFLPIGWIVTLFL